MGMITYIYIYMNLSRVCVGGGTQLIQDYVMSLAWLLLQDYVIFANYPDLLNSKQAWQQTPQPVRHLLSEQIGRNTSWWPSRLPFGNRSCVCLMNIPGKFPISSKFNQTPFGVNPTIDGSNSPSVFLSSQPLRVSKVWLLVEIVYAGCS